MIEATSSSAPISTLATVFWRLFENEFATLDGIAISTRATGGMDYIDGSMALRYLLLAEEPDPSSQPGDPLVHHVHLGLYAAAPAADTVVSGLSRHLRALLMEGMDLPGSTSMLRNRGVTDLRDHLVAPGDLVGPRLAATLARAVDAADQKGMKHVLVVTTDGMVFAAGSPPFETMAHWHNVEFAARVECMRIEEADVHRVRAEPTLQDG